MENNIGQILKDRRLELGLTMKEVGAKVGVNEATISRWESGEIANMRRDRIALYADALMVSPAVIMGWEPVADQRSTMKRLESYCRILNDDGINRLIEYAELLAEKYKK